MGVWLGPRAGKPDPIALYAPGDTNVFTAVEYKVAYSNGEAAAPGDYYQEDYVDVAVINRYSSGQQSWIDRGGLLVCGPVDLTKYKKVSLDYTNGQLRTNAARLYVSTSANSYDAVRDTWIEASGASGSLELDVSDLRGTHYVGISLLAAGYGSTRTEMYITSITVTAD